MQGLSSFSRVVLEHPNNVESYSAIAAGAVQASQGDAYCNLPESTPLRN